MFCTIHIASTLMWWSFHAQTPRSTVHLEKPVKHILFGEPFGNDYYHIYVSLTMEFAIPLPGMSPKFLTSVQRFYWSSDTIAKMWNNINRRKVKKRYIHPGGYEASKNNNWHRPISFSFILFIYLMASSLITSWQIDGETVETVADFILGGLQNHCRWWLQPWN